MKKLSLYLIVILLSVVGCEKNEDYKAQLNDPELFHSAVKQLTDVIVYDIFSPPVASRVYMYQAVASYVIMQKAYPDKYNKLDGQLNGLTIAPDPTDENVNLNLAAFHSYTVVGKNFIFSEDKITEYQAKTYESLLDQGLPNAVLEASQAYGEKIAEHIFIGWTSKY